MTTATDARAERLSVGDRVIVVDATTGLRPGAIGTVDNITEAGWVDVKFPSVGKAIGYAGHRFVALDRIKT